MPNVAIKGSAYCLNFAPELGFHYGVTPLLEHKSKPGSEFLQGLPKCAQTYEEAASYAPNLTYIGAMTTDELAAYPSPWIDNLAAKPTRFGKYGEIMPEDEFLGLMDICDVFDLIWLEKGFAASVRAKLEKHPLLGEAQMKRLEEGHDLAEIEKEMKENHGLPLYFGGKVVGVSRRGHEVDENLNAEVLMENVACKAGGVLALLHVIKNAGIKPEDVDFVVECSEEAAGDMNQRGGGNIAKAVAEIAECSNASGFDIRGFCAGPTAALIAAAGMVGSGIRPNVVVLAGGAIPKLYMNSRDHVKKNIKALENCMGNFAILLSTDDGTAPVMRLDSIGKHSVGAGASPQAITSALVWEPLQKLGLGFNDVDKYAPELHIPEITLPAGAGNVPEANYKMIAALGVMKGQVERAAINDFVLKHGLPGFAHTQGHIPSGVPFIGHAVDGIKEGKLKRVMIIGKGSLFLGRLTNLADGASFLIEPPVAGAAAQGVSKDEVKGLLLEALSELAENLQKN